MTAWGTGLVAVVMVGVIALVAAIWILTDVDEED